MFSEDRWPTKTLQEYLKKLEEMYLGNVRRSMFKDQQLEFKSDADLLKKIQLVEDELGKREGKTSAQRGKTKRIRIRSRNKGFR